MREIKFRGLSVRTGEWLYGSLLTMNNTTYIEESKYGDLDDIDFGFGFEEVVLETVGQFTGLKDKNGIEIYEGDILLLDRGSKRIVFSVRGGFGIEQFENDFNKSKMFYESLGDRQTCGFIESSTTVIGNIHENPELLEEA